MTLHEPVTTYKKQPNHNFIQDSAQLQEATCASAQHKSFRCYTITTPRSNIKINRTTFQKKKQKKKTKSI